MRSGASDSNSVVNAERVKVPPANFRLVVDNRGAVPSSYAVLVPLLTGVIAISLSSLRTGEALIALTVVSLGLWRGLYVTGSWLASALLSH